MLHVTCTRGREYEVNFARVEIIRGSMHTSNSLRFCDNAKGFARMCLINSLVVPSGIDYEEMS